MSFGNPIVAGYTLVRRAIRSKNFVAGTAGWQISADGTAEFSNATIRGQLQAGGDGTVGHPGTTYNAPIPAEVAAFYAAGTTTTIAAPETVVNVNITSDGAGNQFYTAVVIDSSTPRVTSLVQGSLIAGVVVELGRVWLDAQPVLATPSKLTTFFENTKLIINTGADVASARVLLATATAGDQVDRWDVDASGKQQWGPGANTAPDTVLYRAAAGKLAVSQIAADIGGVGETWHAFPFANGWANGANVAALKYRKNAHNEVELDGVVVSPNPFNAVIGTLPVGYRPPAFTDQGVYAWTNQNSGQLVKIDGNGVCTGFGSNTIGTTWWINGKVRLDA